MFQHFISVPVEHDQQVEQELLAESAPSQNDVRTVLAVASPGEVTHPRSFKLKQIHEIHSNR